MDAYLRCFIVAIWLISGALASCPNGWSQYYDSCYHFSGHDTKTWVDAVAVCKLDNAYLAEIGNAQENNFLKPMVPTDMWLGGSDLNVEGEWLWITSHVHIGQGYTNWWPGKPSNSHGDENCAEILPNGQWNDDSCSKLQRYICERPTSTTSEVVG